MPEEKVVQPEKLTEIQYFCTKSHNANLAGEVVRLVLPHFL